MVKTIVAKEKLDCTHLLGQFLDESHYDTVVDYDCNFYIPNPCSSIDALDCDIECEGCPLAVNEQRVGFILRKGYFTEEEQRGAYEGLHEAADVASNNRGLAAGPKVEKVGNRDWLTACQTEILDLFQKAKQPLPGFDPVEEILEKYKDGDKESPRGCMWLYHATRKDNFNWNEWFERVRHLPLQERKQEAEFVEKKYISISTYASPVNSGVAGSQPPYPRFPYARLAAYNRNFPEKFAKSLPFLQKLSEGFRDFLPHRWSNQFEACSKIDDAFVVEGTVFTTITVNKTFRTAAHLDAGDLEAGFSNLTVLNRPDGDYTGGLLVLPEYRTAINIRPGDLLLVANHNIIHGNTPIEGSRLSLVCYCREDLVGTGSFAYNQARFEYVEARKKDPVLSAGRTLFNGVTPGMFQEQAWYDFCISKIGEEETYRMHPEARPVTEKASSLEDWF